MRIREWIPSAPITRSYCPFVPSLNHVDDIAAIIGDRIVVPNRIGIPEALREDVVQLAAMQRDRCATSRQNPASSKSMNGRPCSS